MITTTNSSNIAFSITYTAPMHPTDPPPLAGVREPRRPKPSPVQSGGFYEADEPLEKILAILARGPHGLTAPPHLAV